MDPFVLKPELNAESPDVPEGGTKVGESPTNTNRRADLEVGLEGFSYREGFEVFQGDLHRLREIEDAAQELRERLGIEQPPPTYVTD